MTHLVLGLVLFIGMHSISIFALPLRNAFAAKSDQGWKALYGLVSLAGLVLLVKGYGEARMDPTVLYVAPLWLRHVTYLLMLPVFVLFFAPYFPGRIGKAIPHPQITSVIVWAAAHLLVNGTLADVVLFGAFLAWGIVDRISLSRRPVRAIPGTPVSAWNDWIVIAVGLAVYVGFVIWLHGWLTGVPLAA